MMSYRSTARLLAALILVIGAALVSAQQRLPMEPPRQFGTSVTGAFEGWFDNTDGSHNFLVGYLNRNLKQAVDIPIGPNNRIEPGGPDYGQPTHFLPGRQTGMFIVTVPKDFTPEQRLTWTLTVNGQSMSIPLRLNTDYVVSPFTDVAVGNTPPVVRLEEKGSPLQGPVAVLAKAETRTATVGAPLPLMLWATDDAKFSSGSSAPQLKPPPPVVLSWSKYRGLGTVTFDKDKPTIDVIAGGKVDEAFSGKAAVSATFSAPGDYVLHVVANDYSGDGGGGEVCCWTFALVKVTVTP